MRAGVFYLCAVMHSTIIILDFGSQYTQLIARRVRELNVFCEIHPYHSFPFEHSGVQGVIFSGSPCSVLEEGAPEPLWKAILEKYPVLAVCYGAQFLARNFGGRVERSQRREYGKATMFPTHHSDPFLQNLPAQSQVWMSHGDTILELPDMFEVIARTEDIDVAAFRAVPGKTAHAVYGVQYHPEVTHTDHGRQMIENFVIHIAGCTPDWTPASFVEETVDRLRTELGDEHVLMALSGGVDSSVAATLIHRAIGDRLHGIFLDNGLLRYHEFDEVMAIYKKLGLNLQGVDSSSEFYTALEGLSEPEAKRKAIGRTFIEVFERAAEQLPEVQWLGQGTIYPDVIESVSVHGPSVTIKSHHNVGGLPDILQLKIVEPLRMLFKDEVRAVGRELGIPEEILGRHPFPGPGLGIRILGEITPEKVRLLQLADHIFIGALKSEGLYDKVWQAGVILLPIQSVGVMGDERTYEQAVALRAVTSVDGMTAEWSRLPYDFLARVSNRIINEVRGINRVVYDISTKPPATIEWE